MFGFVIWCVLFPILTGIVLVVQHWSFLIRTRDQYSRDELVGLAQILPAQLERLTGVRNRGTNILGFFLGVTAAWLLTLFGGLVSPDVSPAPDYASGQIPNYFFQSILFPAILHLIWPSLRETAQDYGTSIGGNLVQAEVPFLFGLTTALAAVSLTVWGVYHEMGFFFCALNMLACMVYAGFRLEGAGGPDEATDDGYGRDQYAEEGRGQSSDIYDEPDPIPDPQMQRGRGAAREDEPEY